LKSSNKQLVSKIDTFETEGSGWILDRLVKLDCSVYHLDPLRASSYHRLPQWIIKKHAVRNIKNEDQECFKWAVLAGLHEPTSDHPAEVFSYRVYEDEYD